MRQDLTRDISDEALLRLEELAQDHGRTAIEFAGVFFSESGFQSWAHNKISPGAYGIFQCIPSVLVGLGWKHSPDDFRKLTAYEQLAYAEKYYAPHKGKLKSQTHIYLANFLPADLYKADDLKNVLSDKNGVRAWVYSSNAAFDVNKDGRITVDELGKAIVRACRGPRWRELHERVTGFNVVDPPRLKPGRIESIADLQAALVFLRFSVGPIDGIKGPRTDNALRLFQADRGLVPDAIMGPKTRARLEAELKGL